MTTTMKGRRPRAFWVALLLTIILLGIPELGSDLRVQAQTQATVTVAKVSVAKDRVGNVNVSVKGVPSPGLRDFQGKLTYDPTVAWVQEVVGLNDYNIFAFQIDNSNGEVRFIGAKVTGQLLTQGSFLQFKMRAVAEPGKKTTLTLTFTSFNTPDGSIPHSVVNGELTVITPQELKADFTFSPAEPEVDQEVQFTDKSTAGGTITSWSWDFGDGATSAEQNPTHIYTQAGRYTVKLTVKDEAGNTASKSKEITVVGKGEAPPPVSVHVFPNPARTSAEFKYGLPEGTTKATLWVFNMRGGLVFSKSLSVSGSRFSWNLRDSSGQNVPNGPYYFRVTALTSSGERSSPVGRLVVRR